jgi:hypothetical protein
MNAISKSGQTINPWSILLLSLLLIIRIPFEIAIDFFYPTIPDWAITVIELGAYVCLALLIWVERNDLSSFHIDRASILILILSGTIFQVEQISLSTLLFWLTGLFLLFLYIKGYFNYKIDQVKNFIFPSLILGISLSVILGLLPSLLKLNDSTPAHPWPGQ